MIKNLIRNIVLFSIRIFANIALRLNRPKIIGITGSVGKSSARNAIQAVLQDEYLLEVIDKGNSETGVPLGILGIHVKSLGFTTLWASIVDWLRILAIIPFRVNNLFGVKYLIVEMGIDSPNPPKNMSYLLQIVKPDIAVFLNVQPVHTLQFDRLVDKKLLDEDKIVAVQREIAKEKVKIITESGCHGVIYNAANQFVKEVVDQAKTTHPTKTYYSFGATSKDSVQLGPYGVSTDKAWFSFIIRQNNIATGMTLEFKQYLLPEQYKEVFAAAIVAGLTEGMRHEQIKKSLEKNFSLPPSRASVLPGINGTTIIDSSYNASPVAVETCLMMMGLLNQQTKRDVVFVFGDMRELGQESEYSHEKVAHTIVEKVNYLYCVGPMTRAYVMPVVSEKLKDSRWFKDTRELGLYLEKNVPQDSLVLVKGSQNALYLEEAIKYLLKNKDDYIYLCRQEPFWMNKKKEFFESLMQ